MCTAVHLLGNTNNFKHCFLVDTCTNLRPQVPQVWISGNVSTEFQSRVGSALFACFAEANVMYIHSPRSTSGATCADLLVAMHHASIEVGHGSDSNGQSPARKTNALPLLPTGSGFHYLFKYVQQ